MAKSKKKVSGDDAAGAKPKAKKGDKVPANDVAQQRQALKEIGLRIKKIEEDGNCECGSLGRMVRIAGGCMTETVDGVRGRLVPGDCGPAVGRPGEARRGAAEDR